MADDIALQPPEETPPMKEVKPPKPRRKRWPWVLGALAVIALTPPYPPLG